MLSTNSFGIVAHPSRIPQSRELHKQLPYSAVTVDYEGVGNGENHLRCWREVAQKDADWYTVIEDDAILCDNFLRHLGEAQEQAPTDVVSWYVGTGRPTRFQGRMPRRLAAADRTHSTWFVSNFMFHAVAISIRANRVRNMLAFCENLPNDVADDRLTKWVQHARLRVAYSIPSLVDHSDGKSLNPRAATSQRVAWRFGEPTRPWTVRSEPL